MNKLCKIICTCLIVCIMAVSFPVVPKVQAASNGDKKTYTETLTLDQVNTLCNNFESIIKNAGKASTITAGIIRTAGEKIGTEEAKKISKVLVFCVTGLSYISTAEFKSEYNFYKGIRDRMCEKGYQTVTIKYTQIYRVNRMYGDYTGGWYAYGKAVSYYTF